MLYTNDVEAVIHSFRSALFFHSPLSVFTKVLESFASSNKKFMFSAQPYFFYDIFIKGFHIFYNLHQGKL